MILTEKTIVALSDLEAHYLYSPEGEDEARAYILANPHADPIGVPWAKLIVYFEDQGQYDDCAQIVRAILDTYAPRRSVLDFGEPNL